MRIGDLWKPFWWFHFYWKFDDVNQTYVTWMKHLIIFCRGFCYMRKFVSKGGTKVMFQKGRIILQFWWTLLRRKFYFLRRKEVPKHNRIQQKECGKMWVLYEYIRRYYVKKLLKKRKFVTWRRSMVELHCFIRRQEILQMKFLLKVCSVFFLEFHINVVLDISAWHWRF